MKKLYTPLIICLLAFSSMTTSAQDHLTQLLSLKGTWSFSIGMNSDWTKPAFDDHDWEAIRVPSAWEDQGYNGYNGFAFYRKKVSIPASLKGRMLYVNLGYIDDADETFLNGHKIGSSGSFPPNFGTAYNAERIYYIPAEYINFDGSNVLAVKVYDAYESGGITSGEIGIYGGNPSIDFDVNLQTSWKFITGDDMRRKDPGFDDKGWNEVMVPAPWEDQGYRDYDGYGWYRKTIVYNGNPDDKMVIMLGKIDDVDQAYINGTLVASTGTFPRNSNDWGGYGQEYNAQRGYYIPAGLLKKGENVIAVRVLDTGGAGGIYEGPVGLLSQAKYIDYWRRIKSSQR